MEVHRSDIVQSLRGRDTGGYFVVVDENSFFVYLINGKNRRIGATKKKNRKHVRYVCPMDPELAKRIAMTGKLSGSDIKNALALVKRKETQIAEGGI